MYFITHIKSKKIPKYCKKICKKNLRICKKNLYCFSLFEVLYNWVKFRRLKMGDPVYGTLMLLNFCGNQGSGRGLELNFFGFQIKENFWEAKFQVFI